MNYFSSTMKIFYTFSILLLLCPNGGFCGGSFKACVEPFCDGLSPPPPPCPCDHVASVFTGCDPTCVTQVPLCLSFENNCNTGGGGSFRIERTYLNKKKKINQSKIMIDDCVFPDIEISIEKDDMLALLAVGTKRIQSELNSAIVTIDVGMAVEDTQFWVIPTINFDYTIGSESIVPSASPFAAQFPGANIVFKNSSTSGSVSNYLHYAVSDEDITLDGVGNKTMIDSYFYHSFETQADFPLQCGTTVESKTLIQLSYNTDVDSVVETKNLVVQATGMLTPIKESPVKALLSYHDYTSKIYKDGIITDSVGYSVFTWFSVKGHLITGIVKPGSPKEGLVEFVKINYERSIPVCPTSLDLGINLVAGVYKAQTEITCASNVINGPVQFKAASSINLNAGFNTSSEFEALIVADPCLNE